MALVKPNMYECNVYTCYSAEGAFSAACMALGTFVGACGAHATSTGMGSGDAGLVVAGVGLMIGGACLAGISRLGR